MSGFECFGIQHIVWLFILVITGAATVRYRPSRGRKAGALLAVLGRVLPGLYEIGKGVYGLSSLPLHICSMAGYGCFLHWLLCRRKEKNDTLITSVTVTDTPITAVTVTDTPITVLSELLFFPGLPGAFLALLFPGWGYLPPFSFLSACEFLGHFGIVLYVITSIREKALCPARRRALIPVCFCALYFAIIMPFDRATGMNYGFLLQSAPDSPLSWIEAVTGGGAGYYVLYALVVLGAMGICYAWV